MVTTDITYICDCCGRKISKPIKETVVAGVEIYADPYLPDGWQQMINPFGLCCDHCMNAFMNVYDSLRR